MALYELDCADCGATANAGRKDARYCPSCRLLRVLAHSDRLKKTRAKCRTCETAFRPLAKGDYSHCGICAPQRHDLPVRPCSLCKVPTRLPYPGVAVCLPCLKDPTTRPRVTEALRRGQAQRRDANAGRPRREIRRIDETATP
jgi:hypothetical protein